MRRPPLLPVADPPERLLAQVGCPVCGTSLPDGSPATFCSSARRTKQWRDVRRNRARLALAAQATTSTCPECETQWITGLDRPQSAIYCSPACRVRGWRRRHAPQWTEASMRIAAESWI